jgi:hypothetical protein
MKTTHLLTRRQRRTTNLLTTGLLLAVLAMGGCVTRTPEVDTVGDGMVPLDAPIVGVARSPNNVLGQLGVRGVTDTGGDPRYANFLIKLNANGLINERALPTIYASRVQWERTCFLDSVNGVDDLSTNDGTTDRPYKTIPFAITQMQDDFVLVLAPGTYPGGSVTTSTLEDFTIIGLDRTRTTVTYLKFLTSNDIELDLYGVTMSYLEQGNNKAFYVWLYDSAQIALLKMQYDGHVQSVCKLYRSPECASPSADYPDYNYTEILIHDVENIAYDPTTDADWRDGVPATGEEGLDTLAARAFVYAGSTDGEMIYWDATAEAWTNVTATADTNKVLFGGPVPYFDTPTASRIPYTDPVGTTDNVQDALDEVQTNTIPALTNRFGQLEDQTNSWNWARDTWSNSAAYGITDADTNFWEWAATTWSNSTARQISDADTNFWTWAATTWSNAAARGISTDDTNFWAWAAVTWSNSVARAITSDDMNRWNNAGTNIYYHWESAIIDDLEIIDVTSPSGSEIVSNGAFAVDAEWWELQNAVWLGGAVVIFPSGSGTLTTTNHVTFSTLAGKTYRLIVTLNGLSAGTATLGGHTYTLSSGTTTNYMHPTAPATNLVLSLTAGVAGLTIDDVSLQEMTDGDLYVADDAHIGGDLYLGETNSIVFGDGTVFNVTTLQAQASMVWVTNLLSTATNDLWVSTTNLVTGATNDLWVSTTNLVTGATNDLWTATTGLVIGATNDLWVSVTNWVENEGYANAVTIDVAGGATWDFTIAAHEITLQTPTATWYVNNLDMATGASVTSATNDLWIATTNLVTGATNDLWVATTNWTSLLVTGATNDLWIATTNLVTGSTNDLWVSVTNWTDTLFYRTNEVINLLTAQTGTNTDTTVYVPRWIGDMVVVTNTSTNIYFNTDGTTNGWQEAGGGGGGMSEPPVTNETTIAFTNETTIAFTNEVEFQAGLEVPTNFVVRFGPDLTTGSWRLRIDGATMVVERYSAAAWNTVGTFEE